MESLPAIVPLVPKAFTRRPAVSAMRRESSAPERFSIPGLGATHMREAIMKRPGCFLELMSHTEGRSDTIFLTRVIAAARIPH